MNGIFSRLRTIGISPTVNVPNPELGPPLAKALIDGGIPCIEVLNRGQTTAAVRTVENIRQAYPDMLIGVGTVMSRRKEPMTIDTLEQFRQAGAEFFVSPVVEPDLLREAIDHGLVFIPGAETHSEVAMAEWCGASVVKIYPLDSKHGGPKYLHRLNDIFQGRLQYIPSGGIGFTAAIPIADIAKLPYVLAYAGGDFVNQQLIERGNFDEITKYAAGARAEFLKHRPQ